MISIPNAVESDGVTYYNILVKLPLRTITVRRRFSEFETLLKNLSHRLGISTADFPYALPSKRAWFQSNDAVVEERKNGLCGFLESVVLDSTLCNDRLVHEFLQLPKNFKLTSSTSSKDLPVDSALNIDAKNIDVSIWFEVVRQVKSFMEEIRTKVSQDRSVKTRIYLRNQLNRVVKANISKLDDSLKRHKSILSTRDFKHRESVLDNVRKEFNDISNIMSSSGGFETGTQDEENNRSLFSRRKTTDEVKETASTLPLNNQELLQQQIQTHRDQDQEVEQLRTLIGKQRHIAEAINSEVEEQNELLDMLGDDVDDASTKLQGARNRAKRIL